MNPLAGLPHVFNTIFKTVDEICKKYLTPNSLALQRRQMLESLLYRISLQDSGIIQQVMVISHHILILL